jgi:hypothetical protein
MSPFLIILNRFTFKTFVRFSSILIFFQCFFTIHENLVTFEKKLALTKQVNKAKKQHLIY